MKLKYYGPAIVLWNGRPCSTGDVIDVSEDQATELVARDPEAWREITTAPDKPADGIGLDVADV